MAEIHYLDKVGTLFIYVTHLQKQKTNTNHPWNIYQKNKHELQAANN